MLQIVLLLENAVGPPLQIPFLPLSVNKVKVCVLFILLLVVIIVNKLLNLIWGRTRVIILVRVLLFLLDVVYLWKQVRLGLVVGRSVFLFYVV